MTGSDLLTRLLLRALLPAALLTLGACATTAPIGPPRMPDALPAAAPELKRPDGAPSGPLAIQGPDGYLYLSGLESPRLGALYTLHYGGDWDDALGPRPVLAAARVARAFDTPQGPVALAQPEYLQPDANLDGARPVPWDDPTPPRVTKGLAAVTELEGKTITLDRGFLDGVQPGDRYLLLDPRADHGERLGDRLQGLALITQIEEHKARAEILLQGGVRGNITQGAWALFAHPGTTEPPHAGVVEVARVQGGSPAQRDLILAALQSYLDRAPAWRLSARAVDLEVDPLDPELGRLATGQPYVNEPRLLLAASVQDRDGTPHLILNYASTGLSVAHGMIAAVPEIGFDAGPLHALTPEALAPTFHALLTSALVHRGQSAEALVLAETLLRQGGWDGPARWHLRDQLAMRWGQAGHTREALRLVEEDIALARQRQDNLALVNALGTIYALYEDLHLTQPCIDAAYDFYQTRSAIDDGPWSIHAWRAWIDTLYKGDQLDRAEEQTRAFEARCQPAVERTREAQRQQQPPDPDDLICVGDLHHLYLGAYWTFAPEDQARRDRALDRALDLAYLLGSFPLASVRLVQAMQSLRSGDTTGSTIAFLEAERLFDKEAYTPGLARVGLLQLNLFLAQNERQRAFDRAMSSAELYAQAHDTQELIGLYRSLSRLYLNIPPQDLSVNAYVRAAAPVLSEALNLQLAAGDLGSAAEILYISGRFRLASNPDEADKLLTRASDLGLAAARLDIPALAALTRALIARARGNLPEMQQHLALAKRFAQLSGDPALLQTIIQAERGEGDQRDTL